MWTSVPLDLHYTSPIDTSALWDYWHDRTIAGVEEWQEHTYRRAVHLPGGPGIISVHRRGESLNGHALSGEALLADVADTLAARTMLHRTIDASMSPNAVCEGLGEHPWLGELVRTRPGLRAPQHPGWFEVTLRAVLAQQVSLRAARTLPGWCAPSEPRWPNRWAASPTPSPLPGRCSTWPRTRARCWPCRPGAVVRFWAWHGPRPRDWTWRTGGAPKRPVGRYAPCPGSGRGRRSTCGCGHWVIRTASAAAIWYCAALPNA